MIIYEKVRNDNRLIITDSIGTNDLNMRVINLANNKILVNIYTCCNKKTAISIGLAYLESNS